MTLVTSDKVFFNQVIEFEFCMSLSNSTQIKMRLIYQKYRII